MSEWIQVAAKDGRVLDAYVARPEGEVSGSVVVLQEIFGVNPHIQSVADRFAKEGYRAIAPALFDRVERGVSLRYEGEDMQRAVGYMQRLDPKTALLDAGAAFAAIGADGGRTAVVGFCYGGFLSWLCATRGEAAGFAPACAVGYYPGGIGKVAEEEPTCPVLLHFGGDDSHIGPEQVAAVREAHPEVTIYEYPGAQHGFNCDARASYGPEQARLAWERTTEFLRANCAG